MNLLFVGHDLKFINEMIELFKLEKNINVRIDKWINHNEHDVGFSQDCLEWADTIFCEWGLGNVVWYSNRINSDQKLYVRLHRQEIELNYYKHFNLNKINLFFAVTTYYRNLFKEKFSISDDKIIVLNNYINLSKFKNNIEFHEKKYNIALVGYIPRLKRLDIAIDIIEELYKIDSRYKLFLKGRNPFTVKWLLKQKKERNYFLKQFYRILKSPARRNIIFSPFSSKMEEWYKNIGFILSVSDFESFHLAPLEGLASGAFPVVKRWENCEEIYPVECINDSIERLVEYIENPINEISLLQEKIEKYDIKLIYNTLMNIIINNYY